MDQQHGFRKGRGTRDPLFLLTEIIEEHRRPCPPSVHKSRKSTHKKKPGKRRPVFLAFLDIKKAFDRVSRPWLWKKLHSIGIQGKMFRTIHNMFQGMRGRVRVDNTCSGEFPIETGVIQGSTLGTALFNVFLNDLIKEVSTTCDGIQLANGSRIRLICFADDIVLVSDSQQDLQQMLDICYDYACKHRFVFSPKKSKVLIIHRKPKKHAGLHWTLGSEKLEIVKTYKYLGVNMGQTVGLGSRESPFKEYHLRILASAKVRLGMVKHLGLSKDGLRPLTAIRLYKTLVRPILEYAAAVIMRTPAQLAELEKFQVQALKSLLGLTFSTRSSAVRLLTAVVPIRARFAYLRSKYFLSLRAMDRDRIVSRVFRYKFIRTQGAFCEEVSKVLHQHDLSQHCTLAADSDLTKYHAYIFKKSIYSSAYNEDRRDMSTSTKSALFYRILDPEVSYSTALPHPLCSAIGSEPRGTRSSFFKALMGTHYSNFGGVICGVENRCCNFCGSSVRDSVNPLQHALFRCPHWYPERKQWAANICGTLSDFYDSHSIKRLRTIISSSTQLSYKFHPAVPELAFGGNLAWTVQSENHGLADRSETPENMRNISTFLSCSTARLLESILETFSDLSATHR